MDVADVMDVMDVMDVTDVTDVMQPKKHWLQLYPYSASTISIIVHGRYANS